MSLLSPVSAQGQTSGAFLAGLLQTQLAGQQQQTINDYGTKAIDTLGSGYGAARGAITDNFAPALAAVQGGYAAARPDITSNYSTGLADISRGISGYDPYTATGAGANAMLYNALGLGGTGGNADAMKAFTASPQYQWNLDQATANAV